jgi:DNA-binding XRE family transcriptional regulator
MATVIKAKVTRNKLREFRTERRITMGEMAKIMGVCRSAYENWEYGVNTIPRHVDVTLQYFEALAAMGSEILKSSDGGWIYLEGLNLPSAIVTDMYRRNME